MRRFVSWEVPFPDGTLSTWNVYATQRRSERGDLVATVPGQERSCLVELPEGPWFFRAVAVLRSGQELPWQASPTFAGWDASDQIPSAPTNVAVGVVDPELSGRVAFDAPSRAEPPHYLQVIEGDDVASGKLLHEGPALPRGPIFPDAARQVGAPFPVDGTTGTRRVLVRAMGHNGRPSLSPVARTIVSPTLDQKFYAAPIATVNGLATTGFDVPGAGDGHRFTALDGLTTRKFPPWDELDATWGKYQSTASQRGLWFDAPVGALYVTKCRIETQEVDLGAEVTFRIQIRDTLGRRVVDPGIPWDAMSITRWNPLASPELREQAGATGWEMRETTLEGRPRQPLRHYRWELVTGTAPGVAHAIANYLPVLPDQYHRARYVRLCLVLDEPSGLYPIRCPTLTAEALIPRRMFAVTSSPEGVAGYEAPPGSWAIAASTSTVWVKRTGVGSMGWLQVVPGSLDIHGLTAETAFVPTADELAVYDASAGANRRGLIRDVVAGLTVPTGGFLMYGGVALTLAGFLECDASTVSRTTYADLYEAVTVALTSNTTNGAAGVDVAGGATVTAQLRVGWYVEGVGIPAGTKILSIDSGIHITLDQNATATGAVTVRYGPYGFGDGSTTFNLPPSDGRSLQAEGTSPSDGVGKKVGALAPTVNDPQHSHTGAVSANNAPRTVLAGGNNTAAAGATISASAASTGITVPDGRGPRLVARLFIKT